MSITELREKQNITIKEMSKRLGVSVDTIRKWEKRPCDLRVSDARKIAAVLKISLDDIVF